MVIDQTYITYIYIYTCLKYALDLGDTIHKYLKLADNLYRSDAGVISMFGFRKREVLFRRRRFWIRKGGKFEGGGEEKMPGGPGKTGREMFVLEPVERNSG